MRQIQRTKIDTEIEQSHKTMSRIANELVAESKAVAAGTGEKHGGRDLLSLLVRANMETDLSASQRMSDQDVLARTWLYHYYNLSQMLISPQLQRFPLS